MGIKYEQMKVVREFAGMGPTPYILFNDIRSITIGGQYATIRGNHPTGEEQMLILHAETDDRRNQLKELMHHLQFTGTTTYERY